jgi:hypothetical protein
MFFHIGVNVTIACRSRLLPAAEPEISGALASYFREEDIRVNCASPTSFLRAPTTASRSS